MNGNLALLIARTENLGDDIQSIAASRFYPRVDALVDRDRPSLSRDAAPSFVVANGWYSHLPHDFPFPPSVTPFYVSVHIANPKLLSAAAVRHLRRHEPIGCRDLHTRNLLRGAGVKAYFSGCLTTTLEHDGRTRSAEVLLADVDPELVTHVPAALRARARTVTHTTSTGNLMGRLAYERKLNAKLALLGPLRSSIGQRIYASKIARYSPLPTLAEYAVRRAEAQGLLESFMSASLVITSRLHCALPCLAYGTPVVMLHRDPSDTRFTALSDYLTIHDDGEAIDWQPQAPDVSARKRALEEVCREAVRTRRNPIAGLSSTALDEFESRFASSPKGLQRAG